MLLFSFLLFPSVALSFSCLQYRCLAKTAHLYHLPTFGFNLTATRLHDNLSPDSYYLVEEKMTTSEFLDGVLDIAHMEKFPLYAFAVLVGLAVWTACTRGILSKIIGLLLIVGALATTIAVSMFHPDFWPIAMFSFFVLVTALVAQGEKNTARKDSLRSAAKQARR